jgi:hypothetical protein
MKNTSIVVKNHNKRNLTKLKKKIKKFQKNAKKEWWKINRKLINSLNIMQKIKIGADKL